MLGVLVLGSTWIWESKVEARSQAEQAAAEVPDEIDPWAGGYPVPPMPGQRLVEASPAGAAIGSAPAPTPSTTTNAPTSEEEHRG